MTTDIDLDAIRADVAFYGGDDRFPTTALIAAVQRRDDALAAVLALPEEDSRRVVPGWTRDESACRASGYNTALRRVRAAITAHLTPADNPTTED